jgi:hypothetical protein
LGGGLIVPRGTINNTVMVRGPHWYEAQRLNSVLKIYGSFLLGRKSIGVYRANNSTSGVPQSVANQTYGPTPNCTIAHLSNAVSADRAADWLVGMFALDTPRWGPTGPTSRLAVPQGYTHALLLQNQDENQNVWSTLQWASSVGASVLELDPVDGKLHELLDDSPWEPGLQIAIDAGGARLFLLQTH